MYPCDGDREMGPTVRPFTRGGVFQVHVHDVDAMTRAVTKAGLPFHVEPREGCRPRGDHEGGQRELLVQDPYGFLVMVAQRIAERPLN